MEPHVLKAASYLLKLEGESDSVPLEYTFAVRSEVGTIDAQIAVWRALKDLPSREFPSGRSSQTSEPYRWRKLPKGA